MRSGDRLTQLADQLEGMDDVPVTAHPQTLDGVHRALVDELDRLAGVVAGDGPDATERHAPTG